MKSLKLKIMKLKIIDKIIIATFLLLITIQLGIVMFAKSNIDNSNVIIKVDNKIEKIIPINTEDQGKLYKFNFDKNIGYIEVKNGKVRMLKMNKKICPNAICSDTGWIDKSYQSIVCLPNKIIVTIEGIKAEKIDLQAY